MQKLIQSVMSQMGTSEEGATGAVGGIMGMIKGQADPGDFAELASKVPGTEDVIAKAEAQGEGEAEGGGGGLLGGAGGMLGGAASMLGGGGGGAGGGALDLMGVLGKSGIDADKAGPLVTTVLGFLKGKAGEGLVGKIMAKVPGLSSLAG